MEDKTRNALLLGAGFLMGTVGIKALTSPRAKRVYVQGVAKGLQAKAAYQDVVEQAKAQVDDIVAAHVAWKEDLDSRFPSLADRGRPLRSRDDRPGWVSMETYLRAELRT